MMKSIDIGAEQAAPTARRRPARPGHAGRRWPSLIGPDRSPLLVFATATLVLVVVLVITAGLIASRFFQQAILERESRLVGELVQSLLISATDSPGTDPAPLEPQFLHEQLRHLLALREVLRVNVFDADKQRIWSSEPAPGEPVATGDRPLRRALDGRVVPVRDPFDRPAHDGPRPEREVVEFYVPIRGTAEDGRTISRGAVGVYRDATELNATIRRGAVLIWSAAGLIGLLLLVTVTALYGLLHRRHNATVAALGALDDRHRRIVQLEKMSALGTMVGEIAHQVNSPLVGVVNTAQLAGRQLDDPQRLRERLREIEDAGRHCADFVRRLLDLSRVSRFEAECADLSRVVRESANLIGQSLRTGSELRLALPPTAVYLSIDPTLVRHAVFNLLRNAVEASPEGTAIDVRLYRAPDSASWLIEVEDRGPGVPPELRPRIFQPFFTTRPDGNGLGLAVAQTVAVLHGGQLTVHDGAEGGALFRLSIPAAQPCEAVAP